MIVYAATGHGHSVLRPQSLFTLSSPAVEMMDTFSLPIVMSLTRPWSPAYTIRFQRLKVADRDTFQSSPVVSTESSAVGSQLLNAVEVLTWRQETRPNDLLTLSLTPALRFRISQHAHGPMKLATLSRNTRLYRVPQT